MVGTLFLMNRFIFKQIETVHVGTDQHVLDPTHPPQGGWVGVGI